MAEIGTTYCMALIEEGLAQSQSDHCVYHKIEEDSTVLILFWVDDIIIATSNAEVLNSIKEILCKRFRMKDLGQLTWFLGIEFMSSDHCIIMHQKKYCEKILDRFNMSDCKPKSIPCNPSFSKIANCESSVLENPKLYREIVGSLIYLMAATRPDLCFVVAKLSQFMSKRTVAQLGVAKHVLRYVKGTLDLGLKFCKTETDSDWGSSENRRSVAGYCFKLDIHGPLISWNCKKQKVVALSTCEAEYVAICHAVQECNFLSQLYADVTGSQRDKVVLLVDNQGAIALAKNPVYHKRSKHIDIKYHYIPSQIEDGNVKLEYIPSEENVADMFTKPFPKAKLLKFSVVTE